jgi:hypothetical protein
MRGALNRVTAGMASRSLLKTAAERAADRAVARRRAVGGALADFGLRQGLGCCHRRRDGHGDGPDRDHRPLAINITVPSRVNGPCLFRSPSGVPWRVLRPGPGSVSPKCACGLPRRPVHRHDARGRLFHRNGARPARIASATKLGARCHNVFRPSCCQGRVLINRDCSAMR